MRKEGQNTHGQKNKNGFFRRQYCYFCVTGKKDVAIEIIFSKFIWMDKLIEVNERKIEFSADFCLTLSISLKITYLAEIHVHIVNIVVLFIVGFSSSFNHFVCRLIFSSFILSFSFFNFIFPFIVQIDLSIFRFVSLPVAGYFLLNNYFVIMKFVTYRCSWYFHQHLHCH